MAVSTFDSTKKPLRELLEKSEKGGVSEDLC